MHPIHKSGGVALDFPNAICYNIDIESKCQYLATLIVCKNGRIFAMKKWAGKARDTVCTLSCTMASDRMEKLEMIYRKEAVI